MMLLGEYRAYNSATKLLLEFFNGDQRKVHLWLVTYNPLLGDTPAHMLVNGRHHRLLKFIRNQLDENKP